MASMTFREMHKQTEPDPLVRVVKDLLERVSVLEVRIRELEYENHPTNVKLS